MSTPNKRIPLHQRVAERLRREIRRDSATGDRLPSETALAVRCKVSTRTVREALATLAEEGLIERRHGSGTYVAPTASRRVAILIAFDVGHSRTSPIYFALPEALDNFLVANGMRTQLYLGKRQPDSDPAGQVFPELLNDAQRHHIHGVIALATERKPAWEKTLQELGVPVVGTASGLDYVVADDGYQPIRQGVAELVRQGCRRLAFLGWSGWNGEHRDRIDCFRDAARQHNVDTDDRWIYSEFHPNMVGAGWEGIREIWSASEEKPDGLLIQDDSLFNDAAAALLDLGVKIPDQLRIVTQAVKGMDVFRPFPVTALAYDPETWAEALGETLIALMAGRKTAGYRPVLTELTPCPYGAIASV